MGESPPLRSPHPSPWGVVKNRYVVGDGGRLGRQEKYGKKSQDRGWEDEREGVGQGTPKEEVMTWWEKVEWEQLQVRRKEGGQRGN